LEHNSEIILLGEASDVKIALKFTYLRTFQEYHIYENEKEILSTTKQDLAIDAWNSILEKNNLLDKVKKNG